METNTLYERLGGAAGVVNIVNDVVEAHMNNAVIQARFLPYKEKPERLAELADHLCKFLAAGSGGPQEYTGRSMPDAHRGMNISNAEYVAAIDDIMGVLGKHDIDAATQKDVLAILYALKGQMVNL
jgi:hemoglobin